MYFAECGISRAGIKCVRQRLWLRLGVNVDERLWLRLNPIPILTVTLALTLALTLTLTLTLTDPLTSNTLATVPSRRWARTTSLRVPSRLNVLIYGNLHIHFVPTVGCFEMSAPFCGEILD